MARGRREYGGASGRDGVSERQGNALFAGDLAQYVRVVGNNAVDADIDHSGDIVGFVHGPDHDFEPEAVGFGDQVGIDIAEIRRPDRAARRLDGAVALSSAMVAPAPFCWVR